MAQNSRSWPTGSPSGTGKEEPQRRALPVGPDPARFRPRGVDADGIHIFPPVLPAGDGVF
jgi:hypothetical protein